MPRAKIFWLHLCQPVVPRDKVADDEILLDGPTLAKRTDRSESNIYWRMRSRKLGELGVKRYFKHGHKWWYLCDRKSVGG